jgi:hypothetical protein
VRAPDGRLDYWASFGRIIPPSPIFAKDQDTHAAEIGADILASFGQNIWPKITSTATFWEEV